MSKTKKLRVLVTGGPTRAYLDDFRFLSNHSTGEVAFHICNGLIRKGIATALVAGPCEAPFSTLKLKKHVPVQTHQQMLAAVLKLCSSFRPDFVIFSAAVLDFEPEKILKGKTSSKSSWTIRLKPTAKIIDQVKKKFPKIKRVGFKLEAGRMDPKKAAAFAQAKATDQDLFALCLNYRADISNGMHRALIWDRNSNLLVNTKREIAERLIKIVCA